MNENLNWRIRPRALGATWGQVCDEVIMLWQTKAVVRAKDGVCGVMKPLKRGFCWVIGHNWLSSRYNLRLGVGGNWKCERCGKFAFRLKR